MNLSCRDGSRRFPAEASVFLPAASPELHVETQVLTNETGRREISGVGNDYRAETERFAPSSWRKIFLLLIANIL